MGQVYSYGTHTYTHAYIRAAGYKLMCGSTHMGWVLLCAYTHTCTHTYMLHTTVHSRGGAGRLLGPNETSCMCACCTLCALMGAGRWAGRLLGPNETSAGPPIHMHFVTSVDSLWAHMCTHLHPHLHTCLCVHTCTHTCTHVYTPAHTCTHTCTPARMDAGPSLRGARSAARPEIVPEIVPEVVSEIVPEIVLEIMPEISTIS